MLGVSARWPWFGGDSSLLQLDYALDVLPLVVSKGTGSDALRLFACPTGGLCGFTSTKNPWTVTSVAFGVMPLGLVGSLRLGDRVRLQVRGGAGVLRFSNPVPLPQGKKLNFVADAGTGIEIGLTKRVAMSFGVRLDHISNGGTSWVNPGMDSRLVEAALHFRR